MVKSAAGITDEDPLETAREKLIECCGDEAIAELLGLASGVLEAVEGERGQPEIAWAAREFADELADVQPLIMVFEDIHWAEEPLLELIDHLAQWVRERALLIICLARPELLEIRPTWGGGRELPTHEQRSTITGEQPFRFKHALIREVAYSGLPKSARAEYHQKFASWLKGRSDKELLEIRAYHLDKATELLTELDGRAPVELVEETAHVLEVAGKRALSREAHRSARKLLLRSVELEPTLERRYNAARAAWRLGDLPALAREMEVLGRDAAEAGDRWIQTRALVALAEVALLREGDLARATALGEEAFAVLEPDDHTGRFEVMDTRARLALWTGQVGLAESFDEQALEAARQAGRKDLESKAALELASVHIARMEIDRAVPLVERACELAEESGSIVTRARGASVSGRLAVVRGDDLEAERLFAQAVDLYTEVGAADGIAFTAKELARVAWRLGDETRAEKLLRESIRMLAPLEERGVLCESQRLLAQLLLARGLIDEAEKLALAARETVGPEDQVSRATTRVAHAQVLAARGLDAEAEQIFVEAVEIASTSEFRRIDLDVLPPYIQFLRERGRDDEAAELEARVVELTSVSAA